jgi:hypothetical protein
VLISLLSKEKPDTKPFKIGLATVIGFISTVIILKGKLFEEVPLALLIYGAFSGLTFGIHRQIKRSQRKSSKTLTITNSETSNSNVSIGKGQWLRSAFQLLMFTLLGLAATYFLILILRFLLGRLFFLK